MSRACCVGVRETGKEATGCRDGEAEGSGLGRQLEASCPNPSVLQTTGRAPALAKWVLRAASASSQASCALRRSAALPWAGPGASPASSALHSHTPAAEASSLMSAQGPAKVRESASQDEGPGSQS